MNSTEDGKIRKYLDTVAEDDIYRIPSRAHNRRQIFGDTVGRADRGSGFHFGHEGEGRVHSDGTPCEAKSAESCPKERSARKADEADGAAGKYPSRRFKSRPLTDDEKHPFVALFAAYDKNSERMEQATAYIEAARKMMQENSKDLDWGKMNEVIRVCTQKYNEAKELEAQLRTGIRSEAEERGFEFRDNGEPRRFGKLENLVVPTGVETLLPPRADGKRRQKKKAGKEG